MAGEWPSARRSVVNLPRLQAQPHRRCSTTEARTDRVWKRSRCGCGCSRGHEGRSFGWAGEEPSAGKSGVNLPRLQAQPHRRCSTTEARPDRVWKCSRCGCGCSRGHEGSSFGWAGEEPSAGKSGVKFPRLQAQPHLRNSHNGGESFRRGRGFRPRDRRLTPFGALRRRQAELAAGAADEPVPVQRGAGVDLVRLHVVVAEHAGVGFPSLVR